MTESHSFQKFPECDHCQFYTGSPFLFCTVHPLGIEADSGDNGASAHCVDFQADTSRRREQLFQLNWAAVDEEQLGEQWQPEGASFYNGELILTPKQRWNRDEQMELLDWHPLFTGRCPNCERPMTQTDFPRVHWDCSGCGWKDDLV